MAMGEAVGVAASLAAGDDGSFHTVDAEALRNDLRSRGAIVDYDPSWDIS